MKGFLIDDVSRTCMTYDRLCYSTGRVQQLADLPTGLPVIVAIQADLVQDTKRGTERLAQTRVRRHKCCKHVSHDE